MATEEFIERIAQDLQTLSGSEVEKLFSRLILSDLYSLHIFIAKVCMDKLNETKKQ
jgi:hypothetical protein